MNPHTFKFDIGDRVVVKGHRGRPHPDEGDAGRVVKRVDNSGWAGHDVYVLERDNGREGYYFEEDLLRERVEVPPGSVTESHRDGSRYVVLDDGMFLNLDWLGDPVLVRFGGNAPEVDVNGGRHKVIFDPRNPELDAVESLQWPPEYEIKVGDRVRYHREESGFERTDIFTVEYAGEQTLESRTGHVYSRRSPNIEVLDKPTPTLPVGAILRTNLGTLWVVLPDGKTRMVHSGLGLSEVGAERKTSLATRWVTDTAYYVKVVWLP